MISGDSVQFYLLHAQSFKALLFYYYLAFGWFAVLVGLQTIEQEQEQAHQYKRNPIYDDDHLTPQNH